jgi:hypothetical protein
MLREQETRMLRPILLALSLVAATSVSYAAVTNTAPSKQELVYEVRHSKHGSLGTYTNVIERNGQETKISTDGKFSVSLIGVKLFNQRFSRVETWRDGRVVAFQGSTTEDGKTVKLTGMAEGDSFVLTTPDGTVMAPANVRIANPWSLESLQGTAMLTPDKGRLEKVALSKKSPETLTIRGRAIRTEQYEIQREGAKSYKIWLDDAGTVVKFALVEPDETVTFTLDDE